MAMAMAQLLPTWFRVSTFFLLLLTPFPARCRRLLTTTETFELFSKPIAARINVTGFGDKSGCHPTVAPQKYYVIFCQIIGQGLVAKFDDVFGAAAEWTERTEERVWAGVGWNEWSDWGPCSATCGEGAQERVRTCQLGEEKCHGYNKERRRCNMFHCLGAVDPIHLDEKLFPESRGQRIRNPSRPTAWRLPKSYVLVSSSQIFPGSATHRPGLFPKEFSLLVTLKVLPTRPIQGTVFSLRSRRQQNAYLSLEMESGDRVRVVHATSNGTQAVVIPMKLNDGHWHQLGLALQDDNSVRSFLDCAWVSTDILKRNELDHPEDADLIIGYLFQGELEQVVIVPDPAAVAQQCSSSRIPIYDSTVDCPPPSSTTTEEPSTNFPDFKSTKDPRWRRHPTVASDDSDFSVEGSGAALNSSDYEVEWSEWSLCSVSCGPGSQSRFSRCVDDGGRMELCMESGAEKTETRPCVVPCEVDTTVAKNDIPELESDMYFNFPDESATAQQTARQRKMEVQAGSGKKHHKHHKPHLKANKSFRAAIKKGGKSWCACLNGGTCLKDGSCQCTSSYHGRLCEHQDCPQVCLNGGVCVQSSVCACPPLYSGVSCQIPSCELACHNGGTCSAPNTCSCPPLTSGQFCQKFECSKPCENGGQCVGPDVCECPHNSTGRNCEVPRCDPPCENGGTCTSGNSCLCSQETTGVRCEKRNCKMKAVRKPYSRGFRRLVYKKVASPCEEWGLGSSRCSKTLPEYETMYKTQYRTVYICIPISDTGTKEND